jgi:aminoglycoside phosphotransferase (APT) family kinase protein
MKKNTQIEESRPDGEEWVEYGGDLIWAAGFTEGGAPYGFSVGEFRQMNERDEPRAGWALAKHVLRQALLSLDAKSSDESIGWIRFLGDGLDYRVYYADCMVPSIKQNGEVRLIVRLPKAGSSKKLDTLAQKEIRVLGYLRRVAPPFRIPKMVATIPVTDGLAMVQEMIYGIPLELRAPRNNLVRPWEVVAQAAAECHAIGPGPLSSVLTYHPTRRHHAQSTMAIFDELDIPESREARVWVEAHLPPEEPVQLLHGDLLGQNLLLDIEDNSLGIIDWSQTHIGDPAYDLAVVTRGKREPFQIKGGLQKLLEAYNSRSGATLTPDQVHLYELCLLAGFYKQDCEEYGLGSAGAENTRAQLRNFLQRIELGE